MNLLEVENLGFGLMHRKQRLTLLRNIHFSLAKGQTMGLVGESGSGKTTIGRCLIRLYEPTQGHIRFDNRDITHLNAAEMLPVRPHMQMIFQDPLSSLNPRKKVWQLIGEGMLMHGLAATKDEAKERVRKILGEVLLDESFANRYPHQLSGGQRQRIGIARAIALKPKLIIADEVVSGLDVSSQAQVLNILKSLVRRYEMSLIFISHDLSVVRLMCDNLLVLYHGETVEQGDCRQIFENPRHDYTKRLIAAIPHITIDKTWLQKEDY